MEDSAGAVSPFAGQVVGITSRGGGELHPPFDQVADGLWPFLHHHAHHIFMADSGTSGQGVCDMRVKGILGGKDRGDAPLGVAGGGFGNIPLGDNGDTAMVCHLQGKGKTGDTAADYKKITFNGHGKLQAELIVWQSGG